MKKLSILLLIVAIIGCQSPQEKLKKLGYTYTKKDFFSVYNKYLKNQESFETLNIYLKNDFLKNPSVQKSINNIKFNGFYISPVLFSKIELTDYFFKNKLLKPDFVIDQSNLLHLATDLYCDSASADRLNMIKYLIDQNCDVNFIDKTKKTPLVKAVINNKPELVKILLQNGAKQNILFKSKKFTCSPLSLATRENYKQIVNLLFKYKGYNIDFVDKWGDNLLQIAIISLDKKKPNYDIINLLIEKGVDLNHTNNDGTCPLYYALIYKNQTLLDLLLKKGANPNGYIKKDNISMPLLIYASSQGYYKSVKKLVNAGAKINKTVNFGGNKFTAIEVAKYSGYSNIASYLKQHGAIEKQAAIKTQKKCQSFASVHFVSSYPCKHNNVLSIKGLDAAPIIKIDNSYRTVSISADCIKGNYQFDWSFVDDCNFLIKPKSFHYKGKFYLNGKSKNYTLYVENYSGKNISVRVENE